MYVNRGMEITSSRIQMATKRKSAVKIKVFGRPINGISIPKTIADNKVRVVVDILDLFTLMSERIRKPQTTVTPTS
jgi:hypothetical protein